MNGTRGRFAPSPTGELHLGNARTALLAWLWARSEGGGFLVRVEDLDGPRVRPGMAEQQLDELRWLGLDRDGEPVFQSHRTALYEAALLRLDTYECFCSRAEIAAAASAPHGEDGPRYPGTCAQLTRAQRDERRRTRPPALRLRAPREPVRVHDELLGDHAFEVDDFVLRRGDGVFSYQLAVSVDDGEQGITQVLRGADLLSSAARQQVLHRMLGRTPPRWAHVPLVHAPSGDRLSKRDRAVSLSTIRNEGTDPRRLVARLARMSGLEAPEACDPGDLVAHFSLGLVPREPVLIPTGG